MASLIKTVGLLHHMGGGNLGDDGTFEAVIQNIKGRWPDAKIIGLSMNPDDTLKRHGIHSHPIRQQSWSLGNVCVGSQVTAKEKAKVALRKYPAVFRLLRGLNRLVVRAPVTLVKELRLLGRSFQILKSLDRLVICGGGQFIESSGGPWEFVGGPWQFPFTIFKWILLGRVVRVKCVVLNVGAGPLVRPLSKWFVRCSLALSDYTSFRDAESQALVRQIGFKGRTHVGHDSAYSLEVALPIADANVGPRTKGNVGFAPMAYGDPRLSLKHDPAVYNLFIRQLAGFCSSLLKDGYAVTLFCTDIGIDPPAIQDLEAIVRGDGELCKSGAIQSLFRVHQWSTRELLQNMSSMDFVAVCRFHAVVFAHLLNIPVLAINHHPKVRAQMNDLGLSEYCVDMENCDLSTLTGTFASLVQNRDQIKSRMAELLACNRRALSEQFDDLFPAQAARPAKVWKPSLIGHA